MLEQHEAKSIYNDFVLVMFQETKIAMLTEDQTNQLLSAFWIQANQTDNTPFNYEAIGHSYSLTVLSSRLTVWTFLEGKVGMQVGTQWCFLGRLINYVDLPF